MRRYTDNYNKARKAGAKPFIMAFVGSDRGTRCFGKETPTSDYVGSTIDTLEWSARVLSFGDFRQALSEESDQIFPSLSTQEMATYTLTCDNADGYFTTICGREEFIGGQLALYQGFAYPGFVFADFQPLFNGVISAYTLTIQNIKFLADQAVEPEDPPAPTLDTTTTYALDNAGGATKAAYESYIYATVEPLFFTDVSSEWEWSMEMNRDTTGTAEVLFRLENNNFGSTRLEIGIDANDFYYVKYTPDALTGSPTYTTITSDVTASTGANFPIFQWGTTPGFLSICNTGDCFEQSLFGYISKFGSSGSGNGQFSFPRGVTIDSAGNIFVADQNNHRVQKFDSSGSYLSQFGSSGSGNGQFTRTSGIDIDSAGNIFVTDSIQNRVQKFDSSGSYLSQFGSSGSGNGQFTSGTIGIKFDSAGNIFVVDVSNHRVQKFDSSGSYLSQFGSIGSGDGQFTHPAMIAINTEGNLFVTDQSNHRVQKFDSSGSYISQFGSSGSGDGQFNNPFGIAIDSAGDIFVSDGNHRVQKFGTPAFDTTEDTPTSNEDIYVGGDGTNGFNGQIYNMNFSNPAGETYQLLNTSDNTPIDFPEQITGTDLALVDGTWTAYGTAVEVTSTVDGEDSIDALTEVVFPTTALYTNPGNNQKNVNRPLIYGDCIENSDAGVWVAPLIDSVNFVYCVAGWTIASVAQGNTVSVWVDDVLTPSGWTFDESDDYESQGAIAKLTFSADQGDSVVTVRCQGKWSGGILLTNPVDIIEDLLDYVADLVGNLAWEKDTTSFAEGETFCILNSYTCAGMILVNKELGFWIRNILNSFAGSFAFNEQGKLVISFLPLLDKDSVQDEIFEYEAITYSAQKDIENVLDRVIINYAVSAVEIDRRFKTGADTSYYRTVDDSDLYSANKNYTGKTWDFNFDWTRNTATVNLIKNRLLKLYTSPAWVVSYQGQDFKYLPIDLLDQLEATLSLIVDKNGDVETRKVFQLREKTINLDDFTSTLTLQGLEGLTLDHTIYIKNDLVYIGSDQVCIES